MAESAPSSWSPPEDQLDEVELLQAMSKTGEFEWTQDPLTGKTFASFVGAWYVV